MGGSLASSKNKDKAELEVKMKTSLGWILEQKVEIHLKLGTELLCKAFQN